MEAQAVPLAPTVYLDHDGVWVSQDDDELAAVLTQRERHVVEWIVEMVRETRWEIEFTIERSRKFRVAWPTGCCDPDTEDA